MKQKYIDLALLDLENASALMRQTPLILKELTFAYLNRANIYEDLAEREPAKRADYQTIVLSAREKALQLLPEIRDSEDQSDCQYTAVLLLSELNEREELRRLADAWQVNSLNVYSYPAHFLAKKFAAMKEYSRAQYWVRHAMARDSSDDHRYLATMPSGTARDISLARRPRRCGGS